MAQDYEVLDFKVGNFQDNYGNTWCDMALKGVGEPVRIVVKDPAHFHTGMTLYGEVREQTSKAGKTYLRFHKQQREEGQNYAPSRPAPAKKDWQPRDDDAIRAQWAIGQAKDLYLGLYPNDKPNGSFEKHIESYAQVFYAMVDRVKGSEATKPATKPNPARLKPNDPVWPSEMEEEAVAIQKGLEADGINLDDIPF